MGAKLPGLRTSDVANVDTDVDLSISVDDAYDEHENVAVDDIDVNIDVGKVYVNMDVDDDVRVDMNDIALNIDVDDVFDIDRWHKYQFYDLGRKM